MGIFPVRKEVAGIGKCRDPAAVLEARVPADMIRMEVGAHHIVDIVHCDARRRQVGLVTLFTQGRLGRDGSF